MSSANPTPVQAGQSDRPVTGIALYLGGLAFLVAMDIVAKLLAERYPIGQMVAFRSLFGLVPVLALVAARRRFGALRARRPLRLVVRGLLHCTAVAAFFYALRRLPIADAYALAFTAPLFVTALSMPLLGERVGVRRWGAVLVGFAGVLVMLRPGRSDDAMPLDGVLAVLIAALAYALMSIATRQVARDETNEAIVLVSTVTVGAVAALTLPFAYVAPASLLDGAALVGLGLCGGVGLLLLTQAFRLAPVAVLAPFEYTTMIYALIFGFLIWGDVPDAALLAGAAIVIGSGAYILHRERLAARRQAPADGQAAPDAR